MNKNNLYSPFGECESMSDKYHSMIRLLTSFIPTKRGVLHSPLTPFDTQLTEFSLDLCVTILDEFDAEHRGNIYSYLYDCGFIKHYFLAESYVMVRDNIGNAKSQRDVDIISKSLRSFIDVKFIFRSLKIVISQFFKDHGRKIDDELLSQYCVAESIFNDKTINSISKIMASARGDDFLYNNTIRMSLKLKSLYRGSLPRSVIVNYISPFDDRSIINVSSGISSDHKTSYNVDLSNINRDYHVIKSLLKVKRIRIEFHKRNDPRIYRLSYMRLLGLVEDFIAGGGNVSNPALASILNDFLLKKFDKFVEVSVDESEYSDILFRMLSLGLYRSNIKRLAKTHNVKIVVDMFNL